MIHVTCRGPLKQGLITTVRLDPA